MKILLTFTVIIGIATYAFYAADSQKSASQAYKRPAGITEYHVARQREAL